MLGQNTNKLYKFPQNWIKQHVGHIDINVRQKWNILWPTLSKIENKNIQVLDAGCGIGEWTLELSKRKSQWNITGIDLNQACIATAQKNRSRLNATSCQFQSADFLAYKPQRRFDLILSISSLHYLWERNKQHELFTKITEWLVDGGTLIALIPRTASEAPDLEEASVLPKHSIASQEEIMNICQVHHLKVKTLEACINKKAMKAKNMYATKKGMNRIIGLPKMLALSNPRNLIVNNDKEPTYAWLLIAQK